MNYPPMVKWALSKGAEIVENSNYYPHNKEVAGGLLDTAEKVGNEKIAKFIREEILDANTK